MKRKANILTKAGVLFIAAFMVLTVLPAVTADANVSIQDENVMARIDSPIKGKPFGVGTIVGDIQIDKGKGTFAQGPGAEGDVLFDQICDDSSASWSFSNIDESLGYGMFENFILNADAPIGKVTITGLNLYHDGSTWVEIDPTLVAFHMEFYDDPYSPQAVPTMAIAGSEFTIGTFESIVQFGATGAYSGYTAWGWTFDLPSDVEVTGQEGWLYLGAQGCLWGSSHVGDLFSYQVGGSPPETEFDRAMTLYEGAGGGPGPGEDCIEDACDFAIWGFSPEFMAMANYDPVLDAYYWNSLPKTLEVSVANRGEIGISELKLLADVYEKICGPTTEIWCDEKYDIQLFDTSPTYPYTFENWVIEDDLDGDSWVLQGGPDNRWLTNNQAWRCTAGEDRSFGDDSDVYLGKNDNPMAGGLYDTLITPGFDIAGAACATFSFSHWCEGEYTIDDDGYVIPVDYGTIAYSINGGVNWTDVSLADFLAYDTNGEWVDVALKFINTGIDADDADYMHPYATICDDCAPAEDDILIEVDFPVDAELQVKFIWDKDPCLQFEGWYIDNMCVTRTEDYELELAYQGHIIMELLPCDPEAGIVWIDVDFPMDWDPDPDTWYEIWICGQVFSPIGCEEDLTNNCFKTQFKIVDVHDMACVGMELLEPEDGTGTPDDNVIVNVTVKNLGSFTEDGVPVELLVGNMVVDEVMNEDFETDPSGKFDAYYFIGGTGDVPFRWTSGDPSISEIYTNDPCQARSKNPGNEALICAEEGTMPYLKEDTACLLVIPETIDLDRNDNGVQDYGDPASATFVFDAKWSMDYVTALGSMAYIGVNMLDGPAAGYTLFMTFGAEASPYYANDWQHIDLDLFDLLDDVAAYWESSYGWIYEDIPEVQVGWVVIADGYGIDFLPAAANGGCSNIYNPVPWTGFMVDRVQLRIVNVDESDLEVVTTGTTGSLAPGAEETLQLTWSDPELCRHALIADVNADDDLVPSNDKCFAEVSIIDEEKCLSGGSIDLTSGGDCLWHACTNRENGDDYFAWTGINEEHWGHYINNMDESLVSPNINITGFTDEGVCVNFTTYYEFANGDFGEFYIKDGGEWIMKKTFQGTSDGGFEDVSVFIPEDECNDIFQIKFRMVSNDEDVSEGWFIDDIYVVDVTDDNDPGTLADAWIGYSDGYLENAYAWTDGTDWTIAIELSSPELDAFRDFELTEAHFAAGSDAYGFYVSGIEISYAVGSLPDMAGVTPIYTGTSSGTGWDTVTVPAQAMPASGPAYLILTYTGYTGYPVGFDYDNGDVRGQLMVYHGTTNDWSYLLQDLWGSPAVWSLEAGLTAGSANVVYGDIIPALMWLDTDGDPAMPHGEVEDFERGYIEPWQCVASVAGNYWKFSQDVSTLPNAAGPYDESLIDPCVNGWHVIEGYPDSGTGLNNAQWFEVDLSDPGLQFARLEFVLDYDLNQESIFVEFSPDWTPGEDMDGATWITYFCHTPGDMYGDNTGGWVGINSLVGDDRFILEEYLGKVVYVRFRLVTEGNGAGVGAGWAIDGLGLSVKRGDIDPGTDEQDPVTSIFFNSDTGTVTLVAVDYPLNKNSGIAGTFYKIDGGAQTTYTVPFGIGEGQHTVEYWSEDNAGNEETHKTVTYTVDSTPPTVALTSPEVGGIYLLGNKIFNLGTTTFCIGKVPIVADAQDAGSGVARVLFDVDATTGYDSTAPYEYTFSGMNFGPLTIKATAIDNNGLASTPAEMTVTCFSLGLL